MGNKCTHEMKPVGQYILQCQKCQEEWPRADNGGCLHTPKPAGGQDYRCCYCGVKGTLKNLIFTPYTATEVNMARSCRL